MSILVTGAAGKMASKYIPMLLEAYDEKLILVDNYSTGSRDSIRDIMNKYPDRIQFFEIDITNKSYLDFVFYHSDIKKVYHLAGLGENTLYESEVDPGKYYTNNIVGIINLLECMRDHKVDNIVYYEYPYAKSVASGTFTITSGIIRTYGRSYKIRYLIYDDIDEFYRAC